MGPVAERPLEHTRVRVWSFTDYAWAVLGWNLLVVLWGAYVRASGSGAGCGSHWPLCNGDVVPRAPRIETIIEFTHRVMSGISLVAVAGLAIWSRISFPRGHRVRRAAAFTVLFLVFEALLGAGLVRFQYVDKDASVGRAIYLSLHLVNTQLLLAALALTAWYSRAEAGAPGPRRKLLTAALAAAVFVSVTGVIAALGDTLFPVSSLAEGMRQDVSATASFLVRLRVLHPVVAIVAGAFFVVAAIIVLRSTSRPLAMRLAIATLVLAVAQLGAGAINLALLAPTAMQIGHLLLADVLWLSLVLLRVEAVP